LERLALGAERDLNCRMLGAIAGDIIGSVFEHNPVKSTHWFPLFMFGRRFTDDTVLTVAVADCLLSGKDYEGRFEHYYYQYPNAGYGAGFHDWARAHKHEPYNSWGNGSAMRVSPVGWAFDNLKDVLAEAKRSADVTHNHPEGVKGAQAVAAAIFLARTGTTKEEIRKYITETFGYNLGRTLDEIRPKYSFDVSCQGSVPEALISFFESTDFESAVRNAISLGGDADTMACIAGAVAEAFYKGVPSEIADKTFEILDPQLADVVRAFRAKFVTNNW
jgi:ADP-ribosylglycohydrolase